MCLAVPGRIKALDGVLAVVDVMGIENTVNVQLIENPKAGDYILIHAGCAVERIHSQYFSYLQDFLDQLINEDNDYGKE